MRILPRYVLSHFLPVFAVSIFGFVGLYLVVDFFERVDRMVEKHLLFQDIYIYFLYKIPLIITQGIPMAAILSTIVALGILKRNRELIAMETAGVNPTYYVAPMVMASLLLSVIHFGINEFAARPLNHKLDEIWEVKVQHKKPALWMNPENMWFREENTIYQIRLYDRQKEVMEKASIFFLDPSFRLQQRVDARRIAWTDSGWVAEEGLLIRFEEGKTDQQWFETRKLDLNVSPGDFIAGETLPDNLAWLDLYRYISKIEQEGFTSTPYRVDLHLRLSSPFATFILALLGITVALKQGLHGGIASGVGISLAVAFAFLAMSNVGSSLASAGILPPFLGVWAGNMMFCALVCYFHLR
ncbi:MAG: LPS export ABC transporter permease LptG [Syntrophobacteraceae bacterium]